MLCMSISWSLPSCWRDVLGKRSSLVSSCNTAVRKEDAVSTQPNKINVQSKWKAYASCSRYLVLMHNV